MVIRCMIMIIICTMTLPYQINEREIPSGFTGYSAEGRHQVTNMDMSMKKRKYAQIPQ